MKIICIFAPKLNELDMINASGQLHILHTNVKQMRIISFYLSYSIHSLQDS